MKTYLTFMFGVLVCVPTFGAHTLISGFETGSNLEAILSGGSIQSSVVRTGQYAYRANPSAGTNHAGFVAPGLNGALRRSFKSARFYIQVAVLPDNPVYIAHIDGAATFNPEVDLNPDGTLSIADSLTPVIATSSASVQADGLWHRVEFDVGVGIRVYVDGALFVSGGSQLYPTAYSMSFGAGPAPFSVSATTDLYIDDILVDDDSFANDGLPGDGASVLLPATGPAQGGTFTAQSYQSGGIGSSSSVLDTMPVCFNEQTGNGGNVATGSIQSTSNPAGRLSQFSFGNGVRNTLAFDVGSVQSNAAVQLGVAPTLSIQVTGGLSKGVQIVSAGLYVNFR